MVGPWLFHQVAVRLCRISTTSTTGSRVSLETPALLPVPPSLPVSKTSWHDQTNLDHDIRVNMHWQRFVVGFVIFESLDVTIQRLKVAWDRCVRGLGKVVVLGGGIGFAGTSVVIKMIKICEPKPELHNTPRIFEYSFWICWMFGPVSRHRLFRTCSMVSAKAFMRAKLASSGRGCQ